MIYSMPLPEDVWAERVARHMNGANMPAFTYFITGVTEDRLVKIGTSQCLPQRLHDLQHSCPVELELLGWMPANNKIGERQQHRTFALQWRRGEIFERVPLMDDMLTEIRFSMPYMTSRRREQQYSEWLIDEDNPLVHSVLRYDARVREQYPRTQDQEDRIILAMKGKTK